MMVDNKEIDHSELFTPTDLRDDSQKKKSNVLMIVLISILVVLIVIASTLLIIKANKDNKEDDPDTPVVDDSFEVVLQSDAYEYYNDNQIIIPKNSGLKVENGIVKAFNETDGFIEITMPLYVGENEEVIVDKEMLVYNPRTKSIPGKIEPLTTISNVDRNLVVSRKDKNADITVGFIHDSKDFYLFLEPMTININKKYTITVGAFSYCEATNNGMIMIFNFTDKTFFIERCEGFVTAEPINENPSSEKDYTLDLIGDSYKSGDNYCLLLANTSIIKEPLV